jgi:hypothetical protein
MKIPTVRKFALFLLIILVSLGSLATTSCARRTTLQKKTRWYKSHHKEGGRIPCPTHDC